MEHTSIDPHMNDNEYVREKRTELKCYYRGVDKADDEDYGTCISWVQLFPAGSAVGTIDDFVKFGVAFVSEDCPLFEKNGTRDEMFQPTSYYGESNIAKNCHGLWTDECKVQVLGHGGNTGGCSSMVKFDPESGLGVVIMTNGPAETMFNYSIPNLLFGKITDRAEFKGVTLQDENDISGIYLSKRTIDTGAACFQKYIGGLFPWQKNAEGSYDMKLLGQNMNPEAKLFKVAENQYIMDNNGMQMFLYQSFDSKGNSKLEMMSTDYVTGSKQTIPMVFLVSILILGAICIVTLLIKIIIFIIRKIKKSDKHYNMQITFMQMLYAATVVLLFGYVSTTVAINHGMMVIISIFAAILGIVSLANGITLGVKTIKTKEMKNNEQEDQKYFTIIIGGRSLRTFIYFGT